MPSQLDLLFNDQVEIGSSWADQMEEGEAMYERDRPSQKV